MDQRLLMNASFLTIKNDMIQVLEKNISCSLLLKYLMTFNVISTAFCIRRTAVSSDNKMLLDYKKKTKKFQIILISRFWGIIIFAFVVFLEILNWEKKSKRNQLFLISNRFKTLNCQVEVLNKDTKFRLVRLRFSCIHKYHFP